MAIDKKSLALGFWDIYLGTVPLKNITNDDVEIMVDGEFYDINNLQEAGNALIKRIKIGSTVSVKLTIAGENKHLLAQAYNWLKWTGTSATDPFAGYVEVEGGVECVPTMAVTGFLHFCDCSADPKVEYESDNLNPLAFQMLEAVGPESLSTILGNQSESTHELTFTATLDSNNKFLKMGTGISVPS